MSFKRPKGAYDCRSRGVKGLAPAWRPTLAWRQCDVLRQESAARHV